MESTDIRELFSVTRVGKIAPCPFPAPETRANSSRILASDELYSCVAVPPDLPSFAACLVIRCKVDD